MRILYYSHTSYADTDIPLVKALVALGHEVCYILKISEPYMKSTLVNIKKLHPKTGLFSHNIYSELYWIQKYIGCDFKVSNVVGFSNKKIDFPEYRALKNFTKNFCPDIIHVVGLANPTELFYVARFYKKIVLTIHDPLPHTGEYSRNAEILKRIELKIVNKIILLNNKQTEVFCSTYKVKQSKIFISSIGYLDWMKMFVREKCNTSPYVLYYGRVSPYKGIDYLLQAMVKLKEEYPSITAIIAGSGKYYFDIEPYKKLDYIKFVNRFIELDELANLITNSAFVVCPYTDATQSGVVSSVLALNKPIIVTNVGALPDMVNDKITGLVIPPKDVDEIRKAISYLWDDENRRKDMEKAIINSSTLGKYSWDKIANNTLKIYKA